MQESPAIEALNGCDRLFLTGLSEPTDNSLRLPVSEGLVADRVESIQAHGVTLSGVRRVEITAMSRVFELYWDTYVSYAVRNESYCSPDLYEEPGAGPALRTYTRSRFLDFVAAGTFASAKYPGPMTHYGLLCGNHVIDVVSVGAPSVRLIDRDVESDQPHS